MTQRTQRIDELLRHEISQALAREVTDPRIGFVTVTDVETARDLSRAKVSVSVIGTDAERKETLAALRRAMPYIRHGLGSKIRLRRMPFLDVHLDDSVQRGSRVLQILNDLEEGRMPEKSSEVGESLPTPVLRLPQEGDTELEAPALKPVGAPTPKIAANRSRRGERTGWQGTRSAAGKSAAAGKASAAGKATAAGKSAAARKSAAAGQAATGGQAAPSSGNQSPANRPAPSGGKSVSGGKSAARRKPR